MGDNEEMFVVYLLAVLLARHHLAVQQVLQLFEGQGTFVNRYANIGNVPLSRSSGERPKPGFTCRIKAPLRDLCIEVYQ